MQEDLKSINRSAQDQWPLGWVCLAGAILFAMVGCSESNQAPEGQSDAGVPVVAMERHSSPYTSSACSNEFVMKTVCGFRNPEDILPLPGDRNVLISEMGAFMTDAPGRLSVFDQESELIEPLVMQVAESNRLWGDVACPMPDAALFSPHGIDLVTDNSDQLRLLVVNHGGRESVEMFEMTEGAMGWQATWRGCALPPGDPFINDVSGLKDGSFLVTHMWDKHLPFEEVARKLTSGEFTGWVWRWSEASGFSKLGGSTELMPNGIVLSADEQFAYVNIYMGNKTIKVDLSAEEKVGEFSVRQPDNITRDEAGALWVASHQHDPLGQNCDGVEEAACLLPFRVVRADPDTLETSVVIDHSGEPMGYATVATKIGDRLFMGSAHGDRIAIHPLN